jgi:hypothetical protein
MSAEVRIAKFHTTGNGEQAVEITDGLAPAPGTYDSVVMDPPDKPTTIAYRTGGPTGTVVATLTLVYSGDDVASITRS